MSKQNNGGEWSIKSSEPIKPKGARKVSRPIRIQNMLLKELLKNRTIAIEKEMIDAKTGLPIKHTEIVKKSTILIIFENLMNNMVFNPDVRLQAMGIKLLTDLLIKTENLVYNPAVLAKIDIDQLYPDQADKEIFLALLQKANQSKRFKEIAENENT